MRETVEKRRWDKRGRAENRPAGPEDLGRVHDEVDPHGADDLAIPDYVMGEFESNRGEVNGRENGEEQEEIVTRIERDETRRTGERAPRCPPDPVYWLIAKIENGRIEVLTLDRDGEELLPVFSHEEEAEMFLQLAGCCDGWRVSERGAGDLLSVLYGSWSDVKDVALDPLPEMVAEGTVGLVSLPRERFIERITARRRPFGLCEPGRGSSREGERDRRSEADGIAAQYPAERFA